MSYLESFAILRAAAQINDLTQFQLNAARAEYPGNGLMQLEMDRIQTELDKIQEEIEDSIMDIALTN